LGIRKVGEQAGGPIEAGIAQEAGGKVTSAMLGELRVDARLGRGIGCTAQRQRYGSKAEFEQPVAARGL
jgi:hypothetical protein